MVLQDRGFVLSDGRYTIQLKQQVDGKHFETSDSAEKMSVMKWIEVNAKKGARIGYDAKVHTAAQIAALDAENSPVRTMAAQCGTATAQPVPEPQE